MKMTLAEGHLVNRKQNLSADLNVISYGYGAEAAQVELPDRSLFEIV